MGGFGCDFNGLGIKKPITHLYPFSKVGITQTQPNPTQLYKLKLKPTHLSIYLCIYIYASR